MEKEDYETGQALPVGSCVRFLETAEFLYAEDTKGRHMLTSMQKQMVWIVEGTDSENQEMLILHPSGIPSMKFLADAADVQIDPSAPPEKNPSRKKTYTGKRLLRLPVQRRVAYAMVLQEHPVMRENQQLRDDYMQSLHYYAEIRCFASGYTMAVLERYDHTFQYQEKRGRLPELGNVWKIILLLDLAAVLGYDKTQLTPELVQLVNPEGQLSGIMKVLYTSLNAEAPEWKKLKSNPLLLLYST